MCMKFEETARVSDGSLVGYKVVRRVIGSDAFWSEYPPSERRTQLGRIPTSQDYTGHDLKYTVGEATESPDGPGIHCYMHHGDAIMYGEGLVLKVRVPEGVKYRLNDRDYPPGIAFATERVLVEEIMHRKDT